MEPSKKIRTRKLVSFDAVPNGVAGTVFKISVCIVVFTWFLLIRTFPIKGRISFQPIQPFLDIFGVIYVAAFFYILHYGALKFAKSKVIRTAWFVVEGLLVIVAVAAFIEKK